MSKKTRKVRKPRLTGWHCRADSKLIWGPAVVHQGTGAWFFGEKNLRAIARFFEKAADWAKQERANAKAE